MEGLLSDKELSNEIFKYGQDVIMSDGVQSMKNFMQHGTTSVFEHILSVTKVSLILATAFELSIGRIFKHKVDRQSLVRGGILHDYFLYDWHTTTPEEGLHGFTHANTALNNATRDFCLNDVEADIISKHMFPLNITPPRFVESVIVCIADKWCATCETLHIDIAPLLIYHVNMKYAIMSGNMIFYQQVMSAKKIDPETALLSQDLFS